MNRTLKTLFLEELEQIYDAEYQIIKALPNLIEAATCDELKSALENHLEETGEQAERLEDIFKTFGAKARRTKCEAVAGLLAEADAVLRRNKESVTDNAAIIAAAQKVEHYEIASYGCLKAWATQLGNSEAATTLEEILDEEKGADLILSELAASKNEEATEKSQRGTISQ
jgi:ferritin-like metal-binding protein YciE